VPHGLLRAGVFLDLHLTECSLGFESKLEGLHAADHETTQAEGKRSNYRQETGLIKCKTRYIAYRDAGESEDDCI